MSEPAATPVPDLSDAPSFAVLAKALGDPARWGILVALGAGEPLMVRELAEVVGHSQSSTSKHLAVLRATGLVVTGRAGLYQIPARFRPTDGERRLDFGRCVLRL